MDTTSLVKQRARAVNKKRRIRGKFNGCRGGTNVRSGPQTWNGIVQRTLKRNDVSVRKDVNAGLRISNEETCYRHAMTFAFRIIAWLLTAAVTFATLGPPQYRPHLGLGQDGEHALAFVLVGLAFGLAYPGRRLLTAGLAVALIGVLELLQLWMPGRHARWEDFVVDALAACAGIAAAAAIEWMMQRSENDL
jgi:hypothetical protein